MEPIVGQIGLLLFAFLLGVGITSLALPRSPRTIYMVAPAPQIDDGISSGQGCASTLLSAVIFIALTVIGLWLISN